MPTTLPERIAPSPPRPVGALAIVAVVLAVIVLACGTLMAPAQTDDGEASPAVHGV